MRHNIKVSASASFYLNHQHSRRTFSPADRHPSKTLAKVLHSMTDPSTLNKKKKISVSRLTRGIQAAYSGRVSIAPIGISSMVSTVATEYSSALGNKLGAASRKHVRARGLPIKLRLQCNHFYCQKRERDVWLSRSLFSTSKRFIDYWRQLDKWTE